VDKVQQYYGFTNKILWLVGSERQNRNKTHMLTGIVHLVNCMNVESQVKKKVDSRLRSWNH
jgi:hypothetical protein